jgi:hypothetical protein
MNIDGSTTTGIAFTATVTEQSCAYQGRIAEYGTGNFVIPDVLTATITSSGCGLVGDQIILVRDYLTAFTWTGTLGTKNAPKSTGNMFQVRLQMVNMNGVGSVRSKFILFVMNTGGVPQCGECWVFVDTFNLAAVPASSGTDTPFLLTFPNIVTGTRLSDGSVSLGDCICLSGVSSMTIAVTAYASQVCCSGTTPSALFVTLGSTETTSLSLAKRTTLGDWYSATSWTNVSHQTVRSVVNFFCQNSAGTNNFNAHVASWIGTNSIRESIFYQNFASNNTPPVCSPFLALLQPAETGAACFVYAYNLITVSE